MSLTLRQEIVLLEAKAKFAKESKELPIPIEKLANLQNSPKPILTHEIWKQVKAGIASTKNTEVWKEWGFQTTNSVLLFSGPPGTGKTITARWVAKTVRRNLINVSAGDIGSGDFGDSERNLGRIFKIGSDTNSVIFFDECDALLWDRNKATGDSMWMLSVINAILTGIEKFDGIVILATNHSHILDHALQRRITFEVKFTRPDYETRKKIWIVKWPQWPLQLPQHEIENLALAELSAAEIENAIKEEARYAINEERKPSIRSIRSILERYTSSKEL